jgi:phenol 2-monooxygenase
MNVSMQDAFNLGWKLAAVLQGRSPASLLRTYSAERQTVAKDLIDFDREWAAMLSGGAVNDPTAVQRHFVQHGRYTAGTATRYLPALLTGDSTHQHLAKGLTIGTRFHSAPVIRVGDGKKMQLGETLAADGRWRLMAFASKVDSANPTSAIAKLCQFLTDSPQSPLKRFTPAGSDVDSVFDVRAVFQLSHHTLAVTDLPTLLFPQKGRYGLHDYEKAFCNIDEPSQDIYALRNINRELGCLVVVRPDQYIAHILPLEDTATLATSLGTFFDGFMLAV